MGEGVNKKGAILVIKVRIRTGSLTSSYGAISEIYKALCNKRHKVTCRGITYLCREDRVSYEALYD